MKIRHHEWEQQKEQKAETGPQITEVLKLLDTSLLMFANIDNMKGDLSIFEKELNWMSRIETNNSNLKLNRWG